MPLSAGTRLGPYEILAPIGAGGMGEVYRARDSRLNRDVAIKVSAAQFSERFEREAKAIAALNHPHICTLHDIGPNYLVMEFIEGTPLNGPFPLDQALRYAVQIADALSAAHVKGITHRDLKPANILVTASGVKLLDFGLAKIGTAGAPLSSGAATQTMGLTEVGTVVGTAAYMSPEQAKGEETDARSDIFSFGLVLYEMLSGRRAFARNSAIETMAAILHKEPEPLQAPPALQSLLARCLCKSPADRFPSMAQVKEALLAATPSGSTPSLSTESTSVERTPSIAVLPFANMSRDADDEFFSDGLAEEIINALVKVPGLKVIARTSAFAFKGQNTDIRKIAEILGVGNILEGSVRRAGNRIRVTAQLITAADGSHLWSERYDRELTDVFAIQDEIAAAIAGALKLKLAAGQTQRHMPSLAAYEAYLKYRYYQWQFTPEASQRSRECLEQALARDPQFALPYVGLADYHLAISAVGGMPGHEAMSRARALAQRALELDPELPEAHAMLGIVAGQYDHDWKETERQFGLAIAHEPISCHLRQWYGIFFLFPMGRAEEALRHMDRVLEEDPLSQMWHWVRSCVLQGLGLDDEALAANLKAVELDPQFWLGWMRLGLLHATHGRHTEARDCAEKAAAAAPWSPYNVGLLAGTLTHPGEADKAEALLAKLRDDTNGAAVGLTCFHLARREIDNAVEWAGKAVEQRFPAIIVLLILPFEPLLRQSPGWPALLKKMNLPET